jgi:hypothetical protein
MILRKHLNIGMRSSKEPSDKYVYYRHGEGEGVILCRYVDDILIFGTNLTDIKEVKQFISRCFEMKDLRMTMVGLHCFSPTMSKI